MRRALGRLVRSRWLRAALAILVLSLAYWRVRKAFLLPRPPRPDAATFAQATRVRILRDRYGVPHVYGKSDGDAAFGLAYANAEDGWPLVQAVLAAAKGRLGLLYLTKKALLNDYFASLVGVRAEVDREYTTLGQDFREVLESYARGLNLYAYLHPGESDGRLFPLTGRDIAAGFAHEIPLMLDVPVTMSALNAGDAKKVGDLVVAANDAREGAPAGSNAHALVAGRSTDGVTRLNVNSHQPWEGPVAWYEAQVVSEEGWNMTGGTFVGAPLILHGHNDHLGWAHTVNSPDLVDAYALVTDPSHPGQYLFEGTWRAFETSEARIVVDTGLFDVTLTKKVLRSVHGPVLDTGHGFYAIRYAGEDRRLKCGEQWFRMNKAQTFEEWKAAMGMHAIPMFNTVYADAHDVYYVYNALLPRRSPGYDYTRVLPGDKEDAVWRDYLPYDALPQVENPPSGFVQNCNSSPFVTTAGDGNPKPEAFDATMGITDEVTNRAVRSLALLGGDAKLSRDDFLAMKWDRTYAKGAAIFRDAVLPALEQIRPSRDEEREALAILRAWDGVANEDSEGASVALLTWRPLAGPKGGAGPKTTSEVRVAFRAAVEYLEGHFGRVHVKLGELQRLRRGNVDLPLGGAPDVINGILARDDGGRLVGYQGDSYVLEVEFSDEGARSQSIHQYGASNRPESKHYADQAPMFVRHELKPTFRREAEVRAALEREYHPGEETR